MHAALFLAGMGVGAIAGLMIGCLAAAAARGDADLERLHRPRMCSVKINDKPCTHLAIVGERFCRQHLLNPIHRNAV